MVTYLTVHTRYNDVQLGLFKDGKLIEQLADDSKKISKNFIFLINQLFENNKISLSDLTFIAAHQGPAPFTTLRVSLAAVNGLAFATNLPLIGINGLEVLLQKYTGSGPSIALLNAFCQDVYYGIYDPTSKGIIIGYEKAEPFIKMLAAKYKDQVIFIGNGSELYKSIITQNFKDKAIFPEPFPTIASLDEIGAAAFIEWKKQESITNQLMPLYIKPARDIAADPVR